MNATLRAISLLFFLLSSECSFSADETNVGGDYYLSSTAGRTYIYKKQNGNDAVVVGEQVLGVASKSNYVFLKRLRLDNYECINPSGEKQISTINSGVVEYWIINLRESSDQGPYDYQSYTEQSKRVVGTVVEIFDYYQNYFNDDISVLEHMKSCQTIG